MAASEQKLNKIFDQNVEITGTLTVGGNSVLTSFTETDPIFSASTAAGITSTNITNWDAAHGWGDHSTAGYLTSYTETDTLATVTGREATTSTDITVGNIFTIKGSTPYIQWRDAANIRLGYIQHNETDLVMSSDTGNISLDPSSGNVSVFGNILLTGTATTTNQGRLIDFTGFDKEGTTDFSDRAYIQHTINTAGHSGSVLVISSQNDANDGIGFLTNGTSQLKHNGHTIWDAGNDGPGSGLDADTVDGIQGSQIWKKGADIGGSQNLNDYTTDGYYHQNSNSAAASGSNYPIAQAGMLEVLSDGVMVYQRYTVYNTADLYVRSYYNGTWYSWGRQWDSSNDGPGSGLNADLLDGIGGDGYLRSNATDSVSGVVTFSTAPRITARNTDSGGSAAYFGSGTRLNEYMSNVGLELHSGNDEPITIYFKSAVNAPSDCGYITYDPDYNNSGENGALVLGSENDGTGSADHIRLQARTIVDSDYHTSDNTEIMEWLQAGTQYAVLNTDYFRHNSDVRAPIFYDSNNTAWYTDPASRSILNTLQLGGSSSDTTNLKLDVQGNMAIRGGNGLYYGVTTNNYNSWTTRMYASGSTQYLNAQQFIFDNQGYGSTTFLTVNTNGIYAPVFYDSVDTNYYVNPNGVSYLNQIDGPYFRNIQVPNSGLGSSYDERVILLIPKVETNNSYNNRIHGKLTMGKTGGNVIDFFDIEAQSVYNNTTVSFTSKGQRTGHKLVTCTYNGIKWVAIKFQYTANPYNFAWFHGEAITNFSTQAKTDMLKVISYADLQSGTTVLNSEIYNSIADYTPSPLHRKVSFGKGTFHVEAETFLIGGDDMTPQLYLEYDNHASGPAWDTAIIIGKTDDLPEGTGFPAYVPTGGYGTMIKANSDGVFFGMEEYSTGNYRPVIQWGDDNTDSPFRIKHENGSEFEVTWDGHATATSSLRAPIFYDSNNTAYNLHLDGTSRINRIDYTELHNTSSSNNGRFLNHSSWGTLHQTDHGYIQIGPANTGYAHIYTDRSNFYFNRMIYINGGTQLNQNDVRSKLFYDLDNTGYYLDAASTSRFYNTDYGNGGTSRNGAVAIGLGDGSLHFRSMTDTNHKMWYYDGVNISTNPSHGHIRFWADSVQRNASTGGSTLIFDADCQNSITTAHGTFKCTGDIIAYSSDARLKENVRLIEKPLNKLKSIRGVIYDWKDVIDEYDFRPRNRKDDVGVIAQEVEAVMPQVVTLAPFDTEMDDEKEVAVSKSGENYKTVQYEKLVPLLIEAVKELSNKVEELENQLNGSIGTEA